MSTSAQSESDVSRQAQAEEAQSLLWNNAQLKMTKNEASKVTDGGGSDGSGKTRCPPGDDCEDTSGNGSGSSGDGGSGDSGSGDGGSGSGGNDRVSRDGSGSQGNAKDRDCSSRDDVSSSDGVQQVETTPSDDTNAVVCASLQRDGPSHSIGSAQHPDGCKPCAFYCYSLRGCKNADGCGFCHLYHESKLRQRREEWKKTQREKRGAGKNKKGIDDEALKSTTAPPETRQPHKTIEQADSKSSKERPSFARSQKGPTSEVHQDSEWSPATKVAYARQQQVESLGAASTPGASSTAHLGRPTMSDERKARGLPKGVAFSGAEATQGAGQPFTNGKVIKQKAQKQPAKVPEPSFHGVPPTPTFVSASPTNVASGTLPQPNLVEVASAMSAAAQNLPICSFAYSPSTAVAGVGQSIELWPPLDIVCRGLVFAVAPELPPGLALEKHTGLIHGTTLAASEGNYFVTACQPGAALNVKISMVSIKIISVQAPGYTMTGLVQPEPGVTLVTLREQPHHSAQPMAANLLPQMASHSQVSPAESNQIAQTIAALLQRNSSYPSQHTETMNSLISGGWGSPPQQHRTAAALRAARAAVNLLEQSGIFSGNFSGNLYQR